MSDADIVEIAERDGFLFAAVTDTWGPRCPDFEPGCWCCKAWAEYDRVTRLRALNAELVEALKAIDKRHIPDQPSALDIPEEDYLRRQYAELRRIARAAIAKAESEGA